ncbi:hypothetical protein [Nonomuraea sp. NPDC023979]|uniref:hypothetical protein n=1 Tax=Nonomuraea sp. NPDC023979 TaxID=3154796 RepID=UPI0033CB6566
MRRFAMTAAALAMTASGFIALTPGVAHAWPSKCTAEERIYSDVEGGIARCTAGTGRFRAMAYCTSDPRRGYGSYYYGDWRRPGMAWSAVQCPSSQRYIVAAGYDLANW